MSSTPTDGLGSGPPQSGTSTSTSDEARDQAQQVAGTAKQEAGRVADEARHQVRGLLDEATSQVTEQSTQQKDRLAGTVRGFADDLQQIRSGEQPSGLASSVVDQVQQGAHDLAERLESRDPAELLDDVRRFARRRPGTFLLGALAAGVVVGRLARGQRDASSAPVTGVGPATEASTTVGTPGPAPTTGLPPVPPTDAATPAFVSGRGEDDAVDEDVRAGDGSHPETEAGPSWTGTETPPVARPGTGGAPL